VNISLLTEIKKKSIIVDLIKYMRPGTLAQLVTFLTCMRSVPGSNLDRDTKYPGCFSWFSSVPPAECRDVLLE
jgi:hypothetical protein